MGARAQFPGRDRQPGALERRPPLLRHYCTWVYAQTGSYSETARRLGLDPRTARDRVDSALLAELQVKIQVGCQKGTRPNWPPQRRNGKRLGRAWTGPTRA